MNLLIVDGEWAARARMIELCGREPGVRVIGEAGTGARAIEAVQSLRPDLTLLDADLPDMSGFDVLRALRPRHQHCAVLVSASTQDIAGAFAAGAIDHLVKPVNEAAFRVTLLRARAQRVPATAARLSAMPEAPLETGPPLLLVGERERRFYPLDPCQISYVESTGNYVTYHHAGIEYIARESIKHLETLLLCAGFMRIQRSLLLNIRAIAYAQPIGRGSFAFTLVSGMRLRSSDTYRESILAALPLQHRAAKRTALSVPQPRSSAGEVSHATVLSSPYQGRSSRELPG